MQQISLLESGVLKKSWYGLILGVASMLLFYAGCTGLEKKEDPQIKQAQWHYEMGTGYFESNEIPLALKELTVALELNPEHDNAHYLLGFVYMGRRNYTKAIYHFRESIRINPDFHFARNNLGTVYLAVERWEEAEELFLQLLEEPLYTTPELAHNNLGWAYYNMKRYPQAREHLSMAIFLKPEMCLAYNNMGLVLEEVRNISEAVRHYYRALEFCPNNYQEPHFNLGRIMHKNQDPKAREHFQQCVQIQPSNSMADRCREYLR